MTQFTDDSGACNANCSLREAILAANAAPGPDTISLPAGTHSLTITGAGEDDAASGDLDITEALTITGAGPDATVIEASGLADRIFHSTCLPFSRRPTEKIYSLPASENFPEDAAVRPAMLPAFGE